MVQHGVVRADGCNQGSKRAPQRHGFSRSRLGGTRFWFNESTGCRFKKISQEM
jgi:hypothetical protein